MKKIYIYFTLIHSGRASLPYKNIPIPMWQAAHILAVINGTRDPRRHPGVGAPPFPLISCMDSTHALNTSHHHHRHSPRSVIASCHGPLVQYGRMPGIQRTTAKSESDNMAGGAGDGLWDAMSGPPPHKAIYTDSETRGLSVSMWHFPRRILLMLCQLSEFLIDIFTHLDDFSE